MGASWEEVPSLAAGCPCGHAPRRVFARLLGAALCAREEPPRAVARSRRCPPRCPPPSAHARRDLLQTEHADLKHLNAKLHELLKERRRDAARASAERQRAAATGVGLAESRDTDREHPLPLPQPSRC